MTTRKRQGGHFRQKVCTCHANVARSLQWLGVGEEVEAKDEDGPGNL